MTSDENLNELLTLPLFKHPDLERIKTALTSYSWVRKEFSPKETLLFQGDTYPHLYLATKGKLSAEMIDYNGKAIKVEDLSPPCPLAPAVLFSTDNILPVSVTTSSPAVVYTIPKQDFLKLCQKEEVILGNFLKAISNRFLFISERLNQISFKTIREKIIHYLSTLPKREDGFSRVTISIEELASFFGVTRPSLSRELLKLEEEGILVRNDKLFQIVRKGG